MKKLCFIIFCILRVNDLFAINECFSNKPMTSDLVKEVHHKVAKALEIAGLNLNSGHCVQAAALNSAIFQLLGFQEGKDFVLISTHLHVHTFIPSTDQILDPTIAQFFLSNPEKANHIVSQRGFLGTKAQLLDFFKRNFGSNAEGIARTGWRVIPDSTEYINFSPPQNTASFSAQQIASDILRNDPQTSAGQSLRSSLEQVLDPCDRHLLTNPSACIFNNSIMETDALEELILNQNFLEILIP